MSSPVPGGCFSGLMIASTFLKAARLFESELEQADLIESLSASFAGAVWGVLGRVGHLQSVKAARLLAFAQAARGACGHVDGIEVVDVTGPMVHGGRLFGVGFQLFGRRELAAEQVALLNRKSSCRKGWNGNTRLGKDLGLLTGV